MKTKNKKYPYCYDSQYRKLYGHNLLQMAEIFNCSTTIILKWHYQNVLKQKLTKTGHKQGQKGKE
jgi:hypothetical protein